MSILRGIGCIESTDFIEVTPSSYPGRINPDPVGGKPGHIVTLPKFLYILVQ